MLEKLRTLLADAFKHWRLVVIVAAIVASLLVWGLSMRPRFIYEATVDIGGVESDKNLGGLVRFQPFEEANEIENFFSHYVFTNLAIDLASRCTAIARYSPTGLRLTVTCRASSEEQAKEFTLFALQPLLDRHARYYAVNRAIDEQRHNLIAHQLQSSKKIIEVLHKQPNSSLAETKIIEHQLKIAELRERMVIEHLLGEQVRPTKLDAESISLLDRKPGFWTWSAVAVLALFSGLFAALMATIPRRLHE